jgi:hypothetical protein
LIKLEASGMKKTGLYIIVLVIGVVIGAAGWQLYDYSISGKNLTYSLYPSVSQSSAIEAIKDPVDGKIEKVIAGSWHAANTVGAAYAEIFEFGGDHTFKFKTSEYDGESRLLDYSGTWELVRDNLLHLTITYKTVWVGGLFEKSSPSSAASARSCRVAAAIVLLRRN